MTDDLQHSLREEFEKLTKQLRHGPTHIAPTIETDDASDDDMLFYETLNKLMQMTGEVVNCNTSEIETLKSNIHALVNSTNSKMTSFSRGLHPIPRMCLMDDIVDIDTKLTEALDVSNTLVSDTMGFMAKIQRVNEILKDPTAYFTVPPDNTTIIQTAYNVALSYINIINKIVEIMRTEYESEKWRTLGTEIDTLLGSVMIPGIQEANQATLKAVATNITEAVKGVSEARRSLIDNLTALADDTDNAFTSVDAVNFSSKVASMTLHGDNIDEVLKVTTKIGHRLASSVQNSLKSKTELGDNFLTLILVFLNAMKTQIASRVIFYDEAGSAQAMDDFIEQQIQPFKNNILTTVPWYQTQMDSAIAIIKGNVNETLNDKRKLLDTSIGIIEKILGHLTWDNVRTENMHAIGTATRDIEKHMTRERIEQTHNTIQTAYEDVMKRWRESVDKIEVDTVTAIKEMYEHNKVTDLRHGATSILKDFINQVNRENRTKATEKLEKEIQQLLNENTRLRDIIANGSQEMDIQQVSPIPSCVDLAKILVDVMEHPENDHNTQLGEINRLINPHQRGTLDIMIEYLKQYKVNTHALNTAMQDVHNALLNGSSDSAMATHMTFGVGAGSYNTTVGAHVKANKEYQKTMKLIETINGDIAKLKELGERLERLAGTGIHNESQMSTLDTLTTHTRDMQFERLKIPTQACAKHIQKLVKDKRDDGVAAVEALILAMEKIEKTEQDTRTDLITKLRQMCADTDKGTSIEERYDGVVTILMELISEKEDSEMEDAENAEVARLNAEVVRLNGEIARLNGEIARLNGEIARLNGEVGKLKRDLQQSQSSCKQANDKLLEVYEYVKPNGYNDYLEDTTDELKKEEAAFVQDDIMDTITQILEQLEENKTNAGIHENEVERLESEVKNIQAKISEIGKALGLTDTLITGDTVLQKAKDVMQTLRTINNTIYPFIGGDDAAKQGYDNQTINMQQLVTGVEKMKKHVDTLLATQHDSIRQLQDQIQQEKNTHRQTITEIYYILNPLGEGQQKTDKDSNETIQAARDTASELRAAEDRLRIFDYLIKVFGLDNTVNRDITFRNNVTQMKEKYEKLGELMNNISMHFLKTPYNDIQIDESIENIRGVLAKMETENSQMIQTLQSLQTEKGALVSEIAKMRQAYDTFKLDTQTDINIIWNVLCGAFEDVPQEDIDGDEEYTPKDVDISFKRLTTRAYHVRKELDELQLEKKVSEQTINDIKPEQSNDALASDLQEGINIVWEILCGGFKHVPPEAFQEEVDRIEEEFDITPLELKVRAYKVRKEMEELREKVYEYKDNPKTLKILSVSTNKLNLTSRSNKAKVLKQGVNNINTTYVQKALTAFKRNRVHNSQSTHLSAEIDQETSELENFTYTALLLLVFCTDLKHQISVYDECILRFTINVLFALVGSQETDQISQCLNKINDTITSNDPVSIIVENIRICGNELYESIGQPESIQLCDEHDNTYFISLLQEIGQCINQVDNHETNEGNTKDISELQHTSDLENELQQTQEELKRAEEKEKEAVDQANITKEQLEQLRTTASKMLAESSTKISRLNEELKQLESEHRNVITQKDDEIRQKADEIRQKEKEIEEKSKHIQQLTEELSSTISTQKETSNELVGLKQELHNLKMQKDALILSYARETEELREELERTHREVQSKQEELTALEKKYNDTKSQDENDISNLTGQITDLMINKGNDKRIAHIALERFNGDCNVFTLDQLCTVPHKDLADDIQYIVHDVKFHEFAKVALERFTIGIRLSQQPTPFEPEENVHINMLQGACEIYVNTRLINLKANMIPYPKNREMLLLLSEFMCAIIQHHGEELPNDEFVQFYKGVTQTIKSPDNSLKRSEQLIRQLQQWILKCIDINENIAHIQFTIDRNDTENNTLRQLLEKKHQELTQTIIVSPFRFSS